VVREGTHINAVGACTPTARELDTSLVKIAKFYGDSVDSVLHEAGDFIIPVQEGAINQTHLRGEIAELIQGKVEGRTQDKEITIFKSLGIAVEDIAAAYVVYQNALKFQRGQRVDLLKAIL